MVPMSVHNIQYTSQDNEFLHDSRDNSAPSRRNTVDYCPSQSQSVAEAVLDQECRWPDTSSGQKH